MTDRLRRDGAHHVLILAEAELDRCRWAVYRVHRCYTAPARAWRSVDTVAQGSGAETGDILGQRTGFEARWHGHADDRLLALEQAAHDAVADRDAA
ncbi:hypothetical protein [Nocardia abscessus]|uniref:hypothetical protein n=1 Tax=Nocardia abscessus TaxID=120957 RepID=UPI0002E006AA|nr:hypothetical protein [Nocardia abscessus]MCC3330981.1 hypothetical protein [Nocardia abscessus]